MTPSRKTKREQTAPPLPSPVVADERFSLKRVRRDCLQCAGGTTKYVTRCPCNGLHGTRCEFCLIRFGMQLKTFRRQYDDRLLDQQSMPPARMNLDALPEPLQAVAMGEIHVDGYHQSEVRVQRPESSLSPHQRREISERLRHGRRKPR